MWYSAGFISHLSFGMVNCSLNNTFKKSKTATHAAVSLWEQLHKSKKKKKWREQRAVRSAVFSPFNNSYNTIYHLRQKTFPKGAFQAISIYHPSLVHIVHRIFFLWYFIVGLRSRELCQSPI